MTVEAIKQAILELPEAERDDLADWLEDLATGDPAEIEALIAVGLSQLDRGESVAGAVSRARLQEKKAAWMAQQPPPSR